MKDGPCPCGSGRKYKDCCGAGATPLALADAGSVRESALSKLLAFAFQPSFDSDHSVAEALFWGDLLRDAAAHEVQWLLDSEDASIKYNAWFLFDWDVDGQGTVAELFLEDEGARLSVAERQFLERLSRANLRLYEVEAVERGSGVRLLDLWTGTRLSVHERTATDHIVTWDLLGARVAPDGAGGNVFEGGLYLYPADARSEILSHFRRLYRRDQRKYPDDDSSAFFRRHGMVFNHLWIDLVAFPEPPRIVTDEGDPLIFCRSVFETDRVDEVRAAISAHPDVRPVGDGRFAWRERIEEGEHLAGTWAFEGQRVVLETASRPRAERGRAWLESLVGGAVRHRATSLETVEQTLDEVRRRRPAIQEDRPPSPSEAEELQGFYDRYYAEWLDMPVPALGNRTPRAAARTKVWRGRLTALLKQFENTAERGARQGRRPYDFRWIWRELGLERPAIS
jgi:hypothetical protein